MCLYVKELVVNLDQTGVHFIPASGRGRYRAGAKHVPMPRGDDERQTTALLAVAASGAMLPPQLIFPGESGQIGMPCMKCACTLVREV